LPRVGLWSWCGGRSLVPHWCRHSAAHRWQWCSGRQLQAQSGNQQLHPTSTSLHNTACRLSKPAYSGRLQSAVNLVNKVLAFDSKVLMFTAGSRLPGHVGLTGVLTHCKSSQLFHMTYMLSVDRYCFWFSRDWPGVQGIP